MIIDLSQYEKKIFSQFGEDGITLKLIELLGTTNQKFLEIGCASFEGCSNVLWNKPGWTGLVIDGDKLNIPAPSLQALVTPTNLKYLLDEQKFPVHFDFLSLDIDFNTYWIWKVLLDNYRPRICIVEYNGRLNADISVTVPYIINNTYKSGDVYGGASLKAIYNIAKANHYSLVYTSAGVNAFFIADECIDSLEFLHMNDCQALYKPLREPYIWIDTETGQQIVLGH